MNGPLLKRRGCLRRLLRRLVGVAIDETLVNLDDVRAAARRIAATGLAVRTPLLPCLWADPGRPLLLKPENLQPIGAFKIRGAFNALDQLTPGGRANGVVAQSSGNHAQAVALAARRLGIHATIVMPDTAPAVKQAATRALGAEVVIVPPADRDTVPVKLAAEHGYEHVPPYDDARIIAGQGTVGLEIAEDLAVPAAAVLIPVSGGGLAAGSAAAIKALSPSTRIIGVEPELAADATESLRTGVRTTWAPELTHRTIADGLRTTSVGVLPFAHLRRYVDAMITAVKVLALRSRLVAEPSGAVTTAAYLFHAAQIAACVGAAEGPLVAVVSGGNVDPAVFARALARPDG
jgi:threonine dehydratase